MQKREWSALQRQSTGRRHTLGGWYLYFNFSFPSGLVTYRTISPSLYEIATTGTPGEFEVNGESVLFGNGQIGARFRGRRWGLSEGISLPLGGEKGVRDDGTREGGREKDRTNIGVLLGFIAYEGRVSDGNRGEGREGIREDIGTDRWGEGAYVPLL